MNFFISDPNDPIIQTWKNVFPELFKELNEMSEDLRNHIRYPSDLFTIQAFIYATYHMKNTAGLLQQRGPVGNPRNR